MQVWDLFLIEMTNWRWSWRTMILTATLAPLVSILALGVFARDSGPATLAYVFSGNLVMALMFGMLQNIQSHMVFLRFTGGMEYFATLPIQRTSLIIAMVAAFLLLALPSVLTTMLVGAWLLALPLQVSPLIVLVIPVCAASLAGIGAGIGTWARTPEQAGALSMLVTLVLLGLGPVVVPPERLPGWLATVGMVSPASHAASALRQCLIGPVTSQLGLDLVALLVIAVVTLLLVVRTIDWRQE